MPEDHDGEGPSGPILRVKSALAVWAFLLASFLVVVSLYAAYSEPFIYKVYELQQLSRAEVGTPDGAIVDYEDYLRVDPDSIQMRGLLIDALLERRRFEKAVGHAEEAFGRAEEENARHLSLLLMGRATLASGDIDGAAIHISRVLDGRPESGEAHYQMAQVHLAHGNFDQMHSEYGQAREFGASYSTNEYAGAWSARIGRVAEFQRELEGGAVSAKRLFELGVEFEKMGRVDEALELFSRAVASGDAPTAAQFWQAVGLEQSGATREAVRAYQDASKGSDVHAYARYAWIRVNGSR